MARTRGAQRGQGRETSRAQGSSSQQMDEQNTQAREIISTLHPLLTLQNQHRLKLLIDGEPVPNLMIRHGFRTVRWNPRYEPYVREAGFLGLHQIGKVQWDDALIRAFVERWRPETHTFHLPVGEMTITLEDVSVLLGLPIHGAPVCGVTDLNWEEEVLNNLGIFPEGRAMANKSALSLSWLRDNFDRLEYNASEEDVKRHARAYMLSLLGTVLFVDLTGDSVPLIYLPFLTNFNETKLYAWGAAVLARVYRQLCHGSGKGSKQMGGCMLLIQLWIWERIPSFQPKELSRMVLEGLNPETVPPRGFYWSGHHSWVENKRSLHTYRVLIDSIQDDDVKWMPYDEEIMNGLPPVCQLHQNYWLSTVALMDLP